MRPAAVDCRSPRIGSSRSHGARRRIHARQRKFARHCGNIEAALYCLGVPVEQVGASQWMQVCGPLPKGMDAQAKRARKNAIKDAVARRFPHLRVTLSTADALGVLWWAMRRGAGGAK